MGSKDKQEIIIRPDIGSLISDCRSLVAGTTTLTINCQIINRRLQTLIPELKSLGCRTF